MNPIDWARRLLENRKVERITIHGSLEEMVDKMDRRVEVLQERADVVRSRKGGRDGRGHSLPT